VVVAILVCAELAAQVVGLLDFRLLEVILAAGRGLPDVDDGVGDGLLGEDICHTAVHEGDLAVVGAADDGVAVVTEGGVGAPEGAEDGVGGGDVAGLEGHLVCYLVDQSIIS